MVLSSLPGASLVPRRLSKYSFPASLVPPCASQAVQLVLSSLASPWCLPGYPIGPFLPPRCLPGASQAVQLLLSCLPGAPQTVQLVLSCLPGASQAVQLDLSCLPGASQGASLGPRRLST